MPWLEPGAIAPGSRWGKSYIGHWRTFLYYSHSLPVGGAQFEIYVQTFETEFVLFNCVLGGHCPVVRPLVLPVIDFCPTILFCYLCRYLLSFCSRSKCKNAHILRLDCWLSKKHPIKKVMIGAVQKSALWERDFNAYVCFCS